MVESREPAVGTLLDSNLAGLGSLRLRNNNAENAVLQTSLDGLLVDPRGEAERPVEFANRALADPVLRCIFGLGDFFRTGLGYCGFFGFSAGASFVFDGRLVVFVGAGLAFLDEAGRALAALVVVLGAAADGEGVAIGPFDVDVLLFDTRELTMEFVGVLELLDIELRTEGAQLTHAGVEGRAGSAVIVVQETEERREFVEAWEHRHCADIRVRCCLRDVVGLLWQSSNCWSQCVHELNCLLCSC